MLEEDEDSIPLKARNYSELMDKSDDESETYGTFNDSSIVSKLKRLIPRKEIVPIRTDRVTGNKYRQVRSLPFDNSTSNYEKEVFNSMTMYELMPRAESRSILRREIPDKETLDGYEWLDTKTSQVLRHNEAIALLLLALMVTVVAFIISQMTSFCWGVINYVYTNNMYNEIVIFLACLVLKCGFVFAAIFFTITTPQTAGSGIPELKAILSGIWIRRYLSIRGFFIKSLALICALGSGLPIGIEGPVIHISAIIGRQLTKISMFQHIERKMLLSAACACGIAVIFSAPIGGVLFSIEVTHHYYKIDSYWSAFLCATFAALFTVIVQAIAPTTLQLLHTSFEEQAFQTYELIIFILLGAISGLLGAAYVELHKYFTLCRPKIATFHNGFWNNSYILAGIVTSSYVLCAFMLGEFAFQPSRMAISDLFNAQSLSDCSLIENHCNLTDWSHGLGVYWNLFCFSILNYLFSICFLVLDWPCGCFASVFAIGAATGRLLGEILNETIMDFGNTKLLAATYAVVGAASLVAGVTRTFSVAVIVIEMTLCVQLSLPVLLGVIVSWTIASCLSDSLYDSILNLRGIPLLPITPKHTTNYAVKPIRPFIAQDFMLDINQYAHLNARSSFREIVLILHHSTEIFFPVIAGNTLLGEVTRQILEQQLTLAGYGRCTEKRRQLVIDATQKLHTFTMYSLHTGHEAKQQAQDEEDTAHHEHVISVVDNQHFATEEEEETLQDKKPKQYMTKKATSKAKKRKWDESGYLKRKKAQSECIDFHEDMWMQHMNVSPCTVIPTVPITQIYILFHVLHPDKIYVTKRNELVGVIDEQILLERERLERNGNTTNRKKSNARGADIDLQ
eukprot:239262_1